MRTPFVMPGILSEQTYDRNTLIAEPGFLLEVYPAPGWFRKPDDNDDEENPTAIEG